MARNAAAGRAWDDGASHSNQGIGGIDGAVSITGKDGKPVMSSEVFARVRARLKAAVGEDVYNSWFARLELEEIVDDLAHLSVPTRFLCSWIQSNYAEKILEAFKAETPTIVRLHFTVRVNGQARPRLTPVVESVHTEPETPTTTTTTTSRPLRDAVQAPRGDALSGSAWAGSTAAARRGRAWPLTRTVKCSRPMVGVSARKDSRIFSA